jgi:hypothetical protein
MRKIQNVFAERDHRYLKHAACFLFGQGLVLSVLFLVLDMLGVFDFTWLEIVLPLAQVGLASISFAATLLIWVFMSLLQQRM